MRNQMLKTDFYLLLREGALIQALITLVFTLVIAYLVIASRPVPEIVTNAYLLILGFYFGSKSVSQTQQTIEKMTGRL